MENDWRYALAPKFAEGWPPFVSCGDGWKDLILKMVADLDALGLPWEIHQLKQKFGDLRAYIDHIEPTDSWRVKIAKPGYKLTDFDKKLLDMAEGRIPSSKYEEFRKILSKAEAKSSRTCEECGKPGKMRNGGWIEVKCDKCHKAPRDYKKETKQKIKRVRKVEKLMKKRSK